MLRGHVDPRTLLVELGDSIRERQVCVLPERIFRDYEFELPLRERRRFLGGSGKIRPIQALDRVEGDAQVLGDDRQRAAGGL